MDELITDVRAQLRAVFAGRSVVIAGGMVVFAKRPIDELRALGAERFLVVASGTGTGEQPEGPDVEVVAVDVEESDDFIDSIRAEERAIEQPSEAVRDALARFDVDGDAIVLAQPFLDVRALGDRRAFGARRPEWVAIEDKTTADDLFDALGVPRPPGVVVSANAPSITRAATEFDRGSGTVWSGDARDGFNGGGARVRWVRDEGDRDEAFELLLPRADRVRVASFVDGVACSMHGFVVDDGVAAFRPVELVSLRSPSAPWLRYCGCATYFDPPDAHVATMRESVRRVGEHLRTSVGFRGAFTLDGISSSDGWVATECNPRFGAGLNYLESALPELTMLLLHHATIERVADVPHAALERAVVDAGSRTRWGGAWTSTQRCIDDTVKLALVGDENGFRRAREGEPADATLSIGPGRTGGHVRIDFDPERTRRGPSVVPLAVAGFAFAEGEFDLGVGDLAAN
jgi:hypothetical protein